MPASRRQVISSTRQPSWLAAVNWQNPLTKGMTHLFNPHGFELVERKQLLVAGTPQQRAYSKNGELALLSEVTGGNGYYAAQDVSTVNAGYDWTLAVLFEFDSTVSGTSNRIVGTGATAANFGSGSYDRTLGIVYSGGLLYGGAYLYDGGTKEITGSTGFDYSNRTCLAGVVACAGGGL